MAFLKSKGFYGDLNSIICLPSYLSIKTIPQELKTRKWRKKLDFYAPGWCNMDLKKFWHKVRIFDGEILNLWAVPVDRSICLILLFPRLEHADTIYVDRYSDNYGYVHLGGVSQINLCRKLNAVFYLLTETYQGISLTD